MSQSRSRFELRNNAVAQPPIPRRPPTRRRQRPFVLGPLDLGWLVRAGNLPGKALFVGLILHFQKGLTRTRRFRFSLTRLSRYGIASSTASRALRHLETAGLVAVERRVGAVAWVTILDLDHTPRDSDPE